LNRLVAVMLALAVVLAIVAGVRALGLAQRGALQAPGRQPNLLGAPELPREEVRVHECTGARGAKVYTSEPCDEGAERAVDVTTIELQPPSADARPGGGR
jgi:hypothetical protein